MKKKETKCPVCGFQTDQPETSSLPGSLLDE